jgi:nucleolar protein 4
VILAPGLSSISNCSFCAVANFSSTIFVSNLSYSTTQESLQAAFDDIAPVKTCFIVHEKAAHLDDATSSTASAKGPSKGVGYVTFAIKEDAEGVISRFGEGSEELKIDGRVVRAKWADRKVRAILCIESVLAFADLSVIAYMDLQPVKGSVEKSSEGPATPTPKPGRIERKKQSQSVAKDPDAIRSLLISNLPLDGLTSTALWKKIRKFTGAEKVQWPLGNDPSKGMFFSA